MCKPSTSTSANEKSKPAWLANLTNGFVGDAIAALAVASAVQGTEGGDADTVRFSCYFTVHMLSRTST